MLERLIVPPLLRLGKGVSVDSRRYIGGLHGCAADHIAKLALVLMKQPGANYSSVYDHRLLPELSRVARGLYKPRDPRLHQLLLLRLHHLVYAQQNGVSSPEIARIRQLIGLQTQGTPALALLPVFNENLHMRMGNCYMHTETWYPGTPCDFDFLCFSRFGSHREC